MQNQPDEIISKRPIFGQRRIVPRATVVDSKKHNQAFLVETLDDLGFIASACANSAAPGALIDTAPDLVVLGISGGDCSEISHVLQNLADAGFTGSVLAIGPPNSVL